MKIREGCEILTARLSELLEQAAAVRQSALRVGRGPTNDARFNEVQGSFGDLAAFVAATLGDVNDRLQRLDEVLRIIHEQSGAPGKLVAALNRRRPPPPNRALRSTAGPR